MPATRPQKPITRQEIKRLLRQKAGQSGSGGVVAASNISGDLVVGGTVTFASLEGVLRATPGGILDDDTTTTHLSEGSNLYFTDERAQDAVGGMLDTTLVYVDGTPLLTRAALTGAITAAQGSNATALGSFTKAELNTAVSDGDPLYVGDVTQYTDEMAQDAVGAMVDATLVYTDATPLLSRAALTGDVTASAGSNATTIANDAVTYAKMQNVSATDRLLGRSTAGAGDVEEITCTAAGRAILDDANAAAQRTTLGLGTAATFNYEEGTFTPSLSAATPGTMSNVYTTRVGRYERLGRHVTGHIDINTNLTKGTATGGARIIDLPYAMSSSASVQIYVAFPSSTGGTINWGASLTHFAAYSVASGSYLEFFAAGSNATSAVISITAFPGGANTVLRLSLNYEA